MDNVDINALKGMWLAHKRAEDDAKAMRLEVEQAILAHFPTDKQEGSITDADAGITVAYKLTRTVDTENLQEEWTRLSPNAQKAFKWKADIDLKQYRAIQEYDAAAFEQISNFVTSKPAKPSITIKGE